MDEQTNIDPQVPVEQRLALLARVESLLANENIIQGFNIWLRSSLPMLALSLLAGFSGLAQTLGTPFQYLSIALNFYLLHLAATYEAKRRWGLKVLPSTWWSIYWRVVLYVLPVSLVLVLVMPIDLSAGQEALAKNAGPLFIAGLIVQVLSIIPTGVAASGAFLIAVRRRRILRELEIRLSKQNNDIESGEKKSDQDENG